MDHLEGVLSNEPVEVVAGAAIIEVKPQGVSKGGIVERILNELSRRGPPDFVLCIGDDRSDEDMFTAMEHVTFSPHLPAEVGAPDYGMLRHAWSCLMSNCGLAVETSPRAAARPNL